MYSGVPITLVSLVSEPPYERRATPKSVSLSRWQSDVSTRRFSGLMSR